MEPVYQPIYQTGNKIVDEMGKLQMTGNIIPSAWYRTIRRETGKPYLTAIVILSDIVYWYRPIEVRDEGSGKLLGYRKKFKSDLLQRSYQQLADQFGVSKRDATNAIIELERLGVVQRVFRKLEINGQIVPNVLVLKLNVSVLERLTFQEEQEKAEEGFYANQREVSPKWEGGVTQKSETCLQNKWEDVSDSGETNTEITYRNYNREYPLKSYQEIKKRFEEQIEYETLACDEGDTQELDELVEIAVDVLASRADTIRINREEIASERVKERYLQLTMFHIRYVLDCLRKTETKARNIRAVMQTALYNAPSTMNTHYRNLYRYYEGKGLMREGTS